MARSSALILSCVLLHVYNANRVEAARKAIVSEHSVRLKQLETDLREADVKFQASFKRGEEQFKDAEVSTIIAAAIQLNTGI